jgi:hypothetical protein
MMLLAVNCGIAAELAIVREELRSHWPSYFARLANDRAIAGISQVFNHLESNSKELSNSIRELIAKVKKLD